MCSLQKKVWVPCVIRGEKLQYITKIYTEIYQFFLSTNCMSHKKIAMMYILAFKYIRYQRKNIICIYFRTANRHH